MFVAGLFVRDFKKAEKNSAAQFKKSDQKKRAARFTKERKWHIFHKGRQMTP
jgi:hypothetical protein